MDEEEFREFCIKGKGVRKGLSEEKIQEHFTIIKGYEAFMKKRDQNRNFNNATAQDLQSFAQYLVKNSKNKWDTFLALLRYARFVNNKEVEVAILHLLDGSQVLDELSSTVRKAVGEHKHKEIFEGIELPALGTSSKDWPRITKKLMEKLETELDEKTCKEILLSGPHAGPKEYYSEERKKFLESKNIDDFLKKKRQEFVGTLENHMKEKTLFFNQEIDEEVLEFVRNNLEIQGGVREGDIIYKTKIPYMTKEYLQEKDEKMKRYYYCHCPWVREAIKSEMTISPTFCYCSAGFHKRPWDVALDQSVQVDVIESVLKGDLMCRFAIHIPKEYIERTDSRVRTLKTQHCN